MAHGATRQARLCAGSGGLLLIASLWFSWGVSPQPRPPRAPHQAKGRSLQANHLEATSSALRSCPAWETTLPGAWQVEGVESGQGQALYGTGPAQLAIFRRQNPPDCSKARFIVHKTQLGGIGSFLHQAGIALAGALELNRTLLFQDPDDHVYLGDDYCKDLPAMDSCYFMPLSNCTAGLSIPESMPALDFNDPTQTNERFLSEDSGFAPPQFLVPTMFNSLLNASNIPVSRRYYWWRSQAAAYIVRMNPRTIKAVKALRNKYPQPPSLRNAISVHIRRGDKWKEADPISDAAYSSTAETLFNKSRVSCDPSTCLGRNVFLSTEDASAVEYFVKRTKWGVHYVDNPDMWKPDKSLWATDYAKIVGPSNDMLGSLLNLQLALECSAWVGTLSSNWCRLIDQLRSTVGCKAHLPLLDPAQPNPFSYDLGP
mmetsp:Transcript_3379/g.9765  ORF Transcript_3379/g.9765 Transcript_3379/m.9765 type:complete len:428 (+) Transcript_3379:659-1942(+)